jgi:PTH1 family peptidyl-tRNA hydrolase
LKVVAGLGNPGPEYSATRHNIGFMVAELFAARTGIALKKKGHQAIYGVGRCNNQDLLVLLPQTFMNRSGASVGSVAKAQQLKADDLVVVHDEIDLPFGTLRIKTGGGHGGHNGLRDICSALGSGDFTRLRIGVGRPPVGGDVARHVLREFSTTEKKQLDDLLLLAVEALEMLLKEGAQPAMNAFNNCDISH